MRDSATNIIPKMVVDEDHYVRGGKGTLMIRQFISVDSLKSLNKEANDNCVCAAYK